MSGEKKTLKQWWSAKTDTRIQYVAFITVEFAILNPLGRNIGQQQSTRSNTYLFPRKWPRSKALQFMYKDMQEAHKWPEGYVTLFLYFEREKL